MHRQAVVMQNFRQVFVMNIQFQTQQALELSITVLLNHIQLVVRVDEMVAGADSRFRMSGQYFVARLSAGRDASRGFNVSAPITPGDGVT